MANRLDETILFNFLNQQMALEEARRDNTKATMGSRYEADVKATAYRFILSNLSAGSFDAAKTGQK